MHNLRKSILCGSSKEISMSVKKYQANLRTAQLFELISRPPLLYQPCLNVSLPFNRRDDEIAPIVSMNARGSASIPDPDPCLLSIDGFLDSLVVLKNILNYLTLESDKISNEVLESTLKRLDKGILRIKDLKIGLKDFILGTIIGSGAYGIVRTVEERNNPGKVFALKSQYKNAWMYQDCWQQLILERTVLAQATCIQNPWIPQLFYAFQDEDQLHLVMEYQPGGDMYIYLNKAGHLLDDSMIKQYIAEVVEAVHSLHKMGYIHCDIKPENIAIESSGHLKLLDFGSAIRFDADGKAICPTNVGTKEYLNIELLTQRDVSENLLVGPEYDYWAIGVFLYEMYFSRTPFYDEDDTTLLENIKDYQNKLSFPDDVKIPEMAKDLITHLICEPCDRYTYDEVTRHPYFKDVEFAALRSKPPIYIPDLVDDRCTSLFEGGKSRPRDENITIVATNKTFSPKSLKGKRLRENSEMLKKRELIYEAMSRTPEDHQPEIEDYEWEGIPCVRDLPFIGFSFTPGLTLQMKKIIQQREFCLKPPESVDDRFLDADMSVNDSTYTIKMSRLHEENDLVLANAALQKRVKFLTNICEQKLNQSTNSMFESKSVSSKDDKTLTFLTNALETTKAEHSKLIKDSEKARYVYVQAMDLIAAINRMMMVSSRPISEEDVFANLMDKKIDIEEVSKNITNLNYDQIHLVDRALILIYQITKRYATSLTTSHARYEDLSRVKNSTEEKMRKELVKLNDIVKKLVYERDHLEDKITSLTQRLEKTEVESKKYERDYGEYADKYFSLREKLREQVVDKSSDSIRVKSTTSVSTDTKEIEDCDSPVVKELKASLEEFEAENKNLKTEILKTRKEIGEYSIQSMEDKKIQSELRNQICQLRLQLDCFINQRQDIELKLSRNENAAREIHILRQEYEDAKCQLVRCENELLNSSQRERSLQNNMQVYKEQNEALLEEIQNIRTEYAKELEHARKDKQFDEAAHNYEKLEKELKELREERKEDCAKLEHSRIINMQLSSQRDNYVADLREANSEISRLQDEIGQTEVSYQEKLAKIKESNRQYLNLINHLRTLVPESALVNDPVTCEPLSMTKSQTGSFSHSGSSKSTASLRTKLRNPSVFFTKPVSKKSEKSRSKFKFTSPNRENVKFTLKSATNLSSQPYRSHHSEEFDIENIPPPYGGHHEEWVRSTNDFLSENEFHNLCTESTQSSPRESFASDSLHFKRPKDWSKSVMNFNSTNMRSLNMNQRNFGMFNKISKALHKSKKSEFI